MIGFLKYKFIFVNVDREYLLGDIYIAEIW